MIQMAVDYCKCCLAPADICPNTPPPELIYEVIIPPFESKVNYDMGMAARAQE